MRSRLKVLDSFINPSKAEIVSWLKGQYDGYLNEPGVNPESKTETYAASKI